MGGVGNPDGKAIGAPRQGSSKELVGPGGGQARRVSGHARCAGEVNRMDEMQSLKVFVRNVTDFDGLDYHLMEAARAELGVGGEEDQVARRASKLLLLALCAVGIDPRTELLQRERLTRLLRGDPLSDTEVQKSVEYILSQMVIQPKGVLAEGLALPICVERLQALKSSGQLPENAEFRRGVWSRRLHDSTGEGAPILADWREAADGIFCATPTPAMKTTLLEGSPSGRGPQDQDLLILGAVEVKCYRGVSKRNLLAQLDRHLARMAGGLQLRDDRGKVVEREYAPDRLWYAVPEGDGLRVACALDIPFRVAKRKSGEFAIVWTDAMMHSLIRLAIGPRPSAGPPLGVRRRHEPFDAVLPYDQRELEEIGAAMAHYPDVDLSGPEWSSNVEAALIASRGLSSRQVARREIILRRVR
jgi:hypothetical protein